jgi:hypothetical protein
MKKVPSKTLQRHATKLGNRLFGVLTVPPQAARGSAMTNASCRPGMVACSLFRLLSGTSRKQGLRTLTVTIQI